MDGWLPTGRAIPCGASPTSARAWRPAGLRPWPHACLASPPAPLSVRTCCQAPAEQPASSGLPAAYTIVCIVSHGHISKGSSPCQALQVVSHGWLETKKPFSCEAVRVLVRSSSSYVVLTACLLASAPYQRCQSSADVAPTSISTATRHSCNKKQFLLYAAPDAL